MSDEAQNEDPIMEELRNALQGDEDAMRNVAARLRGASADEPNPAERERFMEAVSTFREEYRDLVSNPGDYQSVTKLDSQIAREFPDLDYLARLRIAGNAVRSGSFRTEPVGIDADRASVIQQMQRGRAGYRIASPVVGVDDTDSQAIDRRAFSSGRPVQKAAG